MSGAVRFRCLVQHSQHPDLEARKKLAARFLLARSLRARPEHLSPEQQSLLDDLVSEAEAKAHAATMAKNNALSLSAYLNELLLTLRKHRIVSAGACGTPEHTTAISLSPYFAALKTEVKRMDCLTCVNDRAHSAVCDDGEVDADNLSNGALCLEPLINVFKLAVLIAERAYAEFLPTQKSSHVSVTLKTRRTNEEHIAARTVFPPDDCATMRSAEVILDLPIEDFNEKHYLELLYIALHEVCVHAPEAWLEANQRVPTNERCPLREGFVDAAALRLMDIALRSGATPADEQQDFYEKFILHGYIAHYGRADLTIEQMDQTKSRNSGRRLTVSRRRDGIRLFARLADRESNDAAREAIRIALCMNVLALAPEDRIAFLVKLDWASDPKGPSTTSRQAYLKSLREAALAGDLDALIPLVKRPPVGSSTRPGQDPVDAEEF